MKPRILVAAVVAFSCAFASIVWSRDAHAVDNYAPIDISALTTFNNDSVASLLKTIALGTDHRAYMPATPLGLAIGIDVGIEVTALALPDEFKTALALASGSTASTLPSVVPVPKLNFHKGLPFGVDLGASFITSHAMGQADLFSFIGVEAKWAFIKGGALPAVAARFSGSYGKLWFMETHTYSFDALVSKNLYFIDPYAGAGLKFWSGDLAVPVPYLPGGVTGHASSASPHIFAGLPLKMVFLKLTMEADYNLSGILTYGLKASLGF